MFRPEYDLRPDSFRVLSFSDKSASTRNAQDSFFTSPGPFIELGPKQDIVCHRPQKDVELMKRYRTGLLSSDYRLFEPPPFRRLGWVAHLIDDDELANKSVSMVTTPSPPKEILIESKSESKADHSIFLIIAAAELWDAYAKYYSLGFDPRIEEYGSQNSYDEYGEPLRRNKIYAADFPWACRIAAKASHRLDYVYAMTKFKLSLQTYSLAPVYFNPCHTATIPKPSHISYGVAFAYAIIEAYSVIEQIGLEIRADGKNPSSINGNWNPGVKNDLEARLINSQINLDEEYVWAIRGGRTRLERDQPKYLHKTSKKAAWCRNAVRDRLVSVPDAIGHASYLRSKVSAHYLKPNQARVISVYDVSNVQGLARRLLLETLGFWKNHPSMKR